MVQLKVLSGKMAGTAWVARRFPVRIGRSPNADLQLEESGIWDQHLQLDFSPAEGIVLSAHPNGDSIDIGSLKLQFWLADTRQTDLRLREGFTWAAIAAISFGQVGLIYWLLH
jgi:hypothetical protein